MIWPPTQFWPRPGFLLAGLCSDCGHRAGARHRDRSRPGSCFSCSSWGSLEAQIRIHPKNPKGPVSCGERNCLIFWSPRQPWLKSSVNLKLRVFHALSTLREAKKPFEPGKLDDLTGCEVLHERRPRTLFSQQKETQDEWVARRPFYKRGKDQGLGVPL